MPSKTKKQARFMAACAHGAGYKSCPPQKVSKEFNQADKGSKLLHKAMQERFHSAFASSMGMTYRPNRGR